LGYQALDKHKSAVFVVSRKIKVWPWTLFRGTAMSSKTLYFHCLMSPWNSFHEKEIYFVYRNDSCRWLSLWTVIVVRAGIELGSANDYWWWNANWFSIAKNQRKQIFGQEHLVTYLPRISWFFKESYGTAWKKK
jgi:hypothetical protein